MTSLALLRLAECVVQCYSQARNVGQETKTLEGRMEFQLFKFWAYSDDGYKGQISVISKTKEGALIEAKKVAAKHGMKLA
jgi:hypothetical protein